MRMLDEARAVTTLPGLRSCGAMPLGGAVAITQKAAGHGGFSGLARCGSVWACPECSPVVRADRAANMEVWAAAWSRTGHGTAMATLTTRHWSRARLKPQLAGTAEAWRKLQAGRWWGNWRDRWGIVGVTRALEVTHSWTNSWHSHIHAVIWTETPISAGDARKMEAELYDRWLTLVKAAKLGSPTRKRGVRIDPTARGEAGARDVARYLVKIQDKDDRDPDRALGNELLRGDLKAGRRAGRTPFEILRNALAGDDAELGLWREYEQATKGHRMLTWGGQIRDRLDELVDLTELDPAAVVTGDDNRGTKAVLVQVLPRPWRDTVAGNPGRRGQIRVAVATATAAAMEAAADDTAAARAIVTELLTGWGLVPGLDFYGPGDNRWSADTGELLAPATDLTPPMPRDRRRPRWHTPDELHAAQQLLGIRPQDAVRPEMAARRAAGLPVARNITTPISSTP